MEFGVPMKLVGVIKICLNETCSIFRMGTNLSGTFLLIENDLKQKENLGKFFSSSL
jgi:hypothetical protein